MDSKQKWKEKNPNYQKEYYEKNKVSINKKKKECRAAKKELYAEVAKERYNRLREEILQARKTKRKCSPEKVLFDSAKARAKKKEMPFDIEISDIHIPTICPLLRIPLAQSENKVSDGSPTLDRIDSNRGYIKGNIWVISFRANMIKSNSTFEEFQLIASNWKTLEERKSND